MRTIPLILAALLATAVPYASSAQTTTGSAACSSLYQTAANTVSARIAADDQNIAPPQTIKSLTCLDNFFKGVGLNVITNLLDPTQLPQRDRWADLHRTYVRLATGARQ